MVIPAIIEYVLCLLSIDAIKINLRRTDDRKKGLRYARIYVVIALFQFILGTAMLVIMWTSFHEIF